MDNSSYFAFLCCFPSLFRSGALCHIVMHLRTATPNFLPLRWREERSVKKIKNACTNVLCISYALKDTGHKMHSRFVVGLHTALGQSLDRFAAIARSSLPWDGSLQMLAGSLDPSLTQSSHDSICERLMRGLCPILPNVASFIHLLDCSNPWEAGMKPPKRSR